MLSVMLQRAFLYALQVIAVDSMIATNHLGRIDLAICDLKAKPGSKQCTSLSR